VSTWLLELENRAQLEPTTLANYAAALGRLFTYITTTYELGKDDPTNLKFCLLKCEKLLELHKKGELCLNLVFYLHVRIISILVTF
jgi:hypothetical protein